MIYAHEYTAIALDAIQAPNASDQRCSFDKLSSRMATEMPFPWIYSLTKDGLRICLGFVYSFVCSFIRTLCATVCAVDALSFLPFGSFLSIIDERSA